MRTIYIDGSHHCHVANNGAMTAVETDYFDGKCDAFVEGYSMELNGNGNICKRYPWKPYSELAAAQDQYERDRAELMAAYQEGVNSV